MQDDERIDELSATPDFDRTLFWAGYLLLLPLYLTPLCVTHFLPGLDLPFHLALADLLRKVNDPASPYRQIYQAKLQLAPYALHYFGLVTLGKLCSLELAHKMIMAFYVAALPACAARLLGACRRSRIPALLAFPLNYNMTVHYGFISFALSIPVLLFLLAETVNTGLKTGALKNMGGGLLMLASSVLLFLSHLQNFIFGFFSVLVLICFSPCSWRKRLYSAAMLLPAGGALYFWHRNSQYQRDMIGPKTNLLSALKVVWQVRRAELHGASLLSDLKGRLTVFPNHLLKGFSDGVDVKAAKLFLVLLGVYFLFGLFVQLLPVTRTQERTRAPSLLALLCIIFGALVAYLSLPHHLREFELMTFYPRFAVLLAPLLLLLIPPALKRLHRWPLILLWSINLLFCGWYGTVLVQRYRQFNMETADFENVLMATPPGGKAVGLVYQRNSKVMNVESVLIGLPSYYPIERPSSADMVPILYCGMRHMPCRLLPHSAHPPELNPWAPQQLNVAKALPYFDYFVVRSGPPPAVLFGPSGSHLEVLAHSGTWTVYRKR